MNEPAGLLLLALVLWATAELWPIPALRQKLFGPTLTFRIDLLLLLGTAGWMILRGPVRLEGPVWLEFDVRHVVRCSAEMTTWGLWALLLLAYARRSGRKVEWEYPAPADSAEILIRLGLTLLLLADDWGLFLLGWMLTVTPRPRPSPEIPHAHRTQLVESMGTGLRWFSGVFVALALGFLSWELSLSSWTELSAWLADHPEPSVSQSALLFLSGFSGVLACLCLTSQFPFQSLAIDAGDGSSWWSRPVCVLGWMLPAWTLLWKLEPLLLQFATAAQLGKSLAFLTFFLGSLASLSQRDAIRSFRTIAIAHSGIVLLGLLQPNAELRTCAVGHGLLLIVWIFCWGQVPIWNTLRASGRDPVRAGVTMWLATILLHSGSVGTMRLLAFGDYPGNGLLSFIAWFGLTFAAFRFLLIQTRAVSRTELEPTRFRPRLSTWFPLILAVPLYLEAEHLFPVDHPREPFTPISWELLWTGWEMPVATLLAVALAVVWERSLQSTLRWPQQLESFGRACETHFSLTEGLLLVLRLPLRLAGAAIAAFERGQIPMTWRSSESTNSHDDEPETLRSFAVWDVARGLLSVVILSLVFLWWTR